MRAVFRLALRHEGLIGSIISLPGLALAVPDHFPPGRRATTLEVPRPQPRRDGDAMHLLVDSTLADSTGLRLCGAGEWLTEQHGTKLRRSWRTLHIGLDADTGQIAAASLTAKEGHVTRARAGATIGRDKQVIGDGLRSHTDEGRAGWTSRSTPSVVCWSLDARAMSASPDPERG